MKRILFFFGFSVVLTANAAPVASGRVVLAKERTADAKGIQTLFLSIYDAANPASRMPCAAQKFPLKKDASGEFLTFSLDTSSMTMMGCPEVPASMKIKAKLDKDGSAGPDAHGDLVGILEPVKKGSTGLTVTIKELVP